MTTTSTTWFVRAHGIPSAPNYHAAIDVPFQTETDAMEWVEVNIGTGNFCEHIVHGLKTIQLRVTDAVRMSPGIVSVSINEANVDFSAVRTTDEFIADEMSGYRPMTARLALSRLAKMSPLMGEDEAVSLAEKSSKSGDDRGHCLAISTLIAIAPKRAEEIKRAYPRPDPIKYYKWESK